MKTVANLFATTHAVLGADNQEDRHFVAIERTPPEEDNVCSFVKRVEGLAQHEYWIAREKNILMLLKKTPHMVRLRKEEEKTNSSYQTVKTKDAGVSLAQWLRSKPLLEGSTHALKHPFEQVGAFLKLTKFCLLALKNLHQAGVIHTNLRADNICIPYSPYPYQFDTSLTVDYANLTLIDFMFAISSTLKLSRPLPILSATYASTQSAQLIAALDEDRKNRNAERCQRLDYSVDLYALGFILEQIFQQHLIYPDHLQAELSMEIYQFIAELKTYNNGVPDHVKMKYLHLQPHDGYLKHIDYLLSLDNKALNTDDLFTFDPAQFLEDDSSFPTETGLLATESFIMTDNDNQNNNTATSPDVVAEQPVDTSYVEVNKGVVIALIVTFQIMFFLYTAGDSLHLDILSSLALTFVIGLAATVGFYVLSPKPTASIAPSTRLPSATPTVNTQTTPVAAPAITPASKPMTKASVDDPSSYMVIDKSIVIAWLVTAQVMFFLYTAGESLNLDILSSMSLVLVLGVLSVCAIKLFSPKPVARIRPVVIEPLPAAAAVNNVAQEPQADVAAVVENTANVAAVVSPAAVTIAALDVVTAEVVPVVTPEKVEVSTPPVQLVKPSEPVIAANNKHDDEESVEINKWVVIIALLVCQLGYVMLTTNFSSSDTAPTVTSDATPPTTDTMPATESAIETAEIAPEVTAGDVSHDEAAAANIALLDEVTSVSAPEVASTKSKKEAREGILLSNTNPAKTVKEKPVKPEKTPVAINKTAAPETTATPDSTDNTADASTSTNATTPDSAKTVATTPTPAAVEAKTEAKPTPKSITRGLAEAQNVMGWHYYHGDGVARDYEESFKWFQKAAALGEPSAQFNVGMMYAAGTGTKQDFTEAAKWYKKSAEQGKTSAQLNLGMMYISGRGIRQNLPEGVKWLTKAAEQGDNTAKANLAWLSQQGYVQVPAPAATTETPVSDSGTK